MYDETESPNLAHMSEEERQRWHAERQRWERWNESIPSRFRRAKLADLDADVQEQLRAWLASDSGANLIITGPVGTGKSHAAAAVLREIARAGVGVSFVPLCEMLDSFRPGGPADALEKLRFGVALIDDIGTEKPSEFTAEHIFTVLNRRWLDETTTIVTTNLPAVELEAALGERTFSRLGHGATVLALRGPDRRLDG
jgi:DNA replication protein DnaC